MPAVAVAFASYATGLLAGFAAQATWAACVALFAATVATVRRDAAAVAYAALVAAGATHASLAAREGRRCAEAAALAAERVVVLEDAAFPGARVRGATASDGCNVPVAAAVARGRAPAGSVVRVRGSAVITERGLMVRDAVVVPTGTHRALERARAHAARRVDDTFGDDAPLARALLVADTRQIPAELRDRFAAAGLVHVLSISGLHVAILAGSLQLLLGVGRAPRRLTAAAALLATALYVAMIGFPAPAVRAAAMLGVATAARLAQRPTSPWGALAVGAAGPVVLDARAVLDLGYQLSVVGMAALIAGGAAERRWLRPRLSGWRLPVARELATSVVATVATAPLVAWWFGRVSVAAPLANLVAAPVVAVLQPTLFLALALAPVAPGGARFVGGAAHPLLVALDLIAAFAASLPFAALRASPSVVVAALCAAAAGGVVVACVHRRVAAPLAVSGAALAALAWTPNDAAWNTARAELHMLDVGQGDAVALRTPAGRWVLFDAGPAWRTGDAARRVVIPYVRRRGGAVAAFVLSHPHLDHVGGAATAIAAFDPADYWDAGYVAGGTAYRASLAAAASGGVRWHRARPGDAFRVDGVSVRFLAPDSAWTASLTDANDASTVALVQYGAVRFLLVGDAERAEEEWLLGHAPRELRADVLKVGHHGSSTSSTPAFLAAVRPRVALVSVGLGNDYGHPSPDVVRRLTAGGAEVYRTDIHGTVVVATDGERLTIRADDGEWSLSSRASRDTFAPR